MKNNLIAPYHFIIEPFDNRLRLIVLKNKEEYVCRKETRKKLFQFLENENSTLFKGRLQLIKHDNQIQVKAKNEVLGSIPIYLIKQQLETI